MAKKVKKKAPVKSSAKHPKLANMGAKAGSADFSKRGQPDPQLKKAGWAKKKFNRELIKDLLTSKYAFSKKSLQKGMGKQLRDAFGVDIMEADAGTIMMLQQISKAILQGDTQAINTLLNQAYGYPKETVDMSGKMSVSETHFSIKKRGE